MFRTANPALKGNAFAGASTVDATAPMTIQGTVNKTFMLLLLCMFSASIVWKNPSGVLIGVGAIGGFITAMITIFKREWAPITAPIYAFLEGLVLGGLSVLFEAQYPGIAIQAIGLTFGTLFSLLLVYKLKLIQATQKFRMGILTAMGGIFIFYIIHFVMSLFGSGGGLPMISGNGTLAIAFSFFVVIVAALSLILDFDFIEQGAAQGAPKYMEWYGAFGLMVTLIWLYMEILRLLSKLRSR